MTPATPKLMVKMNEEILLKVLCELPKQENTVTAEVILKWAVIQLLSPPFRLGLVIQPRVALNLIVQAYAISSGF